MNVRTLSSVVSAYAAAAPDELPARLAAGLNARPRCAVTRYLQACRCFDDGRTASAVRHLMIAYQAEPRFESAALLVFSGLNAVSRRSTPLLAVLLETWEEFRRPQFDRTPLERALLDAFAAPLEGGGAISPLARRLWRLPIRTLRAQIREAMAAPTVAPYTLLVGTAG